MPGVDEVDEVDEAAKRVREISMALVSAYTTLSDGDLLSPMRYFEKPGCEVFPSDSTLTVAF